jgi:hypothetical protein
MNNYNSFSKRLETLETQEDTKGILQAHRDFYNQVLKGEYNSDGTFKRLVPRVSPEVARKVPPMWLKLFDLVQGEDGFFICPEGKRPRE